MLLLLLLLLALTCTPRKALLQPSRPQQLLNSLYSHPGAPPAVYRIEWTSQNPARAFGITQSGTPASRRHSLSFTAGLGALCQTCPITPRNPRASNLLPRLPPATPRTDSTCCLRANHSANKMMSSPLKKQPEAVADRVLKRAEISKVCTDYWMAYLLLLP